VNIWCGWWIVGGHLWSNKCNDPDKRGRRIKRKDKKGRLDTP